jgi:hypothetical protein
MFNVDELLHAKQERIDQLHRCGAGRTALLVIDMQRGFLEPGAALEVPQGRDLVQNIRCLIDVCRAKGWRKLRFATREEVMELTGLAPGSIPPFGSLCGLATLCDERSGQSEVINFNAGDHGISVSMRYADYVQVEKPELGKFAE